MPHQLISSKESLEKETLLSDLVGGNYHAFSKLYESYIAQLTNYAFKFTNNKQIVEDALHDIFVYIWNNRTELKIRRSLKAYLFKCVRTSLIKKINKSKKWVFFDEANEKEYLHYFNSNEIKYIENENYFLLKERMSNVLGLLTSKQKEVIYLRFYHELSFDEIAANMNLTTKACYKLMGRAIAELRKTCQQSWQNIILIFLFFFRCMG